MLVVGGHGGRDQWSVLSSSSFTDPLRTPEQSDTSAAGLVGHSVSDGKEGPEEHERPAKQDDAQ